MYGFEREAGSVLCLCGPQDEVRVEESDSMLSEGLFIIS